MLEINSNGLICFLGQYGFVDKRQQKGSDYGMFDPLTIRQIMTMVQIYSGQIFQGRVQNLQHVKDYIQSVGPLKINVTGSLKVESVQRKCEKLDRQIQIYKNDVSKCFDNAKNSLECLIQLSDDIDDLTDDLLVCNKSDRIELSNELDKKMYEFIEQKRYLKKCDDESCKLKEEREKAFIQLENLSAQAMNQ